MTTPNDRIAELTRMRERAEADFHRRIDKLAKRQARIEQEEREIAAEAEREAEARQLIASYQDRLEDVIERLGANVFAPPVACRLHLIDLMRAGHRPGMCELVIPSDGSLQDYTRKVIGRSIVGSPAAMCEGA